MPSCLIAACSSCAELSLTDAAPVDSVIKAEVDGDAVAACPYA
jgi:hypothetical protein